MPLIFLRGKNLPILPAAYGDPPHNQGALQTSVDNKAKWTFTKNSDGTFDIVNLNNQSSGVNAYLRRNANYGFATYAKSSTSGTQPPFLYKGEAATILYTTGESACEHDYSAVVTPPTCTEKGYTTYTCGNCGHNYTADEVKANGHTMGAWYVVDAGTCKVNGTQRRDCSACDHYETKEGSKGDHSYTKVVTPPTCTQDGYTTYTCIHCGNSYTADTVKTNGHAMGDWYVAKAATCTTSGQERRDCKECTRYETRVLNATGHKYNSSNKCANCGDVKLAITGQPKTLKVKSGATGKFTVTATGKNLTYQWQYSTDGKTWKNCAESSAKSATLRVSATTGKSGNYYRCQITDSKGGLVSTSEVRLYVLGITGQPTTQKVKSGATAKFTVSATGTGKTYQWYYKTSESGSWKAVSGDSAKTATLKVSATTGKNGYYYRCKVSDNGGNSTYTDTVRLYVLGITGQPKTQKVKSGATAKFTVTATGAGKTYQWYYKTSSSGSWKKVSGDAAKTATLSFKPTTSKNGYYYRCKVTDNGGNSVYTDTVRLYVLGVKTQPENEKVKSGATAKFTTKATGHDVTYRWQYSTDGGKTWKNCSSSAATKASFSFKATTAKSGYYYRCKITDSKGNVVYTEKAKLTVK